MRCDVESFKDFIQYYTGRYVKGREPDVLYLVDGEVESNVAQFQKYVNGRKGTIVYVHWSKIPETVMFGLPRLGTIVFKNELLFLYYSAERNGGRGYDSRRIGFHSFNSWLLQKANFQTVRESTLAEPHFAHIATRGSHTPWNEAMSDLFSATPTRPAYALSYNFGAYLGQKDVPWLTYKNNVIGDIITPDTVLLTADAARHYEDIIRRTLASDLRILYK